MSGSSDHPGADTLADLDAGVLDGSPVEPGLREHVTGCHACTDRLVLLRDIRALLAGLPPVTVPDDVAARIDAAVAAEASTAPTRNAGWHRPATVAAGIVLVLSAGAGLGALVGRGAPHSGTKTSSGSIASSAKVPGATALSSGPDYTAATLDTYVRGLLAARTDAAGTADPALTRLRQPAALQACVDELAGGAGSKPPAASAGTTSPKPLAVDFARYQGTPAAVIVLADADSTKVQAWVVGAHCRAGAADLLHYQVVRRTG